MKTAKQVALDTGNPQMLEMKIHRFGKSPVRTFKMKLRLLIYTRKECK